MLIKVCHILNNFYNFFKKYKTLFHPNIKKHITIKKCLKCSRIKGFLQLNINMDIL